MERKLSSIGLFGKIGLSASKHVVNFLDPRTWVNFALASVYFYNMSRIGGEWNPMEVLKIIAHPNPIMEARIGAFIASGFRGKIPYAHLFGRWHRNLKIKEFSPFKEQKHRRGWKANLRMGHMLFKAIIARFPNLEILTIHNVGNTINLAAINPPNLKKLKLVETHIEEVKMLTMLPWAHSLTSLHFVRCTSNYDFTLLHNLKEFRGVLGEDQEPELTFAGPASLASIIIIGPSIEKLVLCGEITTLQLLDVSRCYYLIDIEFAPASDEQTCELENYIGTLKIADSLEEWEPEQNYTCGRVEGSDDREKAPPYESDEEFYCDSPVESDEDSSSDEPDL